MVLMKDEASFLLLLNACLATAVLSELCILHSFHVELASSEIGKWTGASTAGRRGSKPGEVEEAPKIGPANPITAWCLRHRSPKAHRQEHIGGLYCFAACSTGGNDVFYWAACPCVRISGKRSVLMCFYMRLLQPMRSFSNHQGGRKPA